MRNKFDMQLDSLKEQLTNMGELCEVAITKATEAILEGKEGAGKRGHPCGRGDRPGRERH